MSSIPHPPVSATNVVARLSVRATSVAVCLVAVALAALVHLGDYETFLFLLGSLFVRFSPSSSPII